MQKLWWKSFHFPRTGAVSKGTALFFASNQLPHKAVIAHHNRLPVTSAIAALPGHHIKLAVNAQKSPQKEIICKRKWLLAILPFVCAKWVWLIITPIKAVMPNSMPRKKSR